MDLHRHPHRLVIFHALDGVIHQVRIVPVSEIHNDRLFLSRVRGQHPERVLGVGNLCLVALGINQHVGRRAVEPLPNHRAADQAPQVALVKISHGGSYTSWYLHLSRPADGLRLGQRVEQGQTIGYVGSTGLVTSTHLDYRLERNGQFIDPLQLEAPVAAPLPAVQMANFSAQRDQWLNLIRQGQQQAAVVLAGSS